MRPTISTRTGDKGTTGLYGGKRVPKSADRLQAYGDVDELNSVLGLILAEKGLHPSVETQLKEIQRTLFSLGADLATPQDSSAKLDRISVEQIEHLERFGHGLEEGLPELQHFILPSGCHAGCLLHVARTVCRRAERFAVLTAQNEDVNSHALIYLNRLSDYLFLAARAVNLHAGEVETEWIPE